MIPETKLENFDLTDFEIHSNILKRTNSNIFCLRSKNNVVESQRKDFSIWQGCKMDCENCELRLRKKHNFANNTIQFFDYRSQSQHNTIWFSTRSQLRKLRKLLYWSFFWKIGQSKLDSRFPEFFKFKFHVWVKMNQKDTPGTKTKVGRVFPMVIFVRILADSFK